MGDAVIEPLVVECRECQKVQAVWIRSDSYVFVPGPNGTMEWGCLGCGRVTLHWRLLDTRGAP